MVIRSGKLADCSGSLHSAELCTFFLRPPIRIGRSRKNRTAPSSQDLSLSLNKRRRGYVVVTTFLALEKHYECPSITVSNAKKISWNFAIRQDNPRANSHSNSCWRTSLPSNPADPLEKRTKFHFIRSCHCQISVNSNEILDINRKNKHFPLTACASASRTMHQRTFGVGTLLRSWWRTHTSV